MTFKFDWAWEPIRFTQSLEQRTKVWAQSVSGHAPHVRKRFIRAQRNKWIKWFKAATGVTTLPKLAVSFDSESAPSDPAVGDVKIVVFPASDAALELQTGLSAPKARRKVMRRALHELTRSKQPHRIELNSSRGGKGPKLLGTRYNKDHVESQLDRAVYLEAFGVAVCPSLTASDVTALTACGAKILDNEPIEMVAPVYGDAGASPDASDMWHLNHINVAAARSKGLTGKGVLIGLLDTGIDASHREFEGKTIYFRAFDKLGAVIATKGAKDFQRHGTHVSALCAGASVGVAPGADLAMAAVLTIKDTEGRMIGQRSQILTGLNWLLQGGIGLPKPVDIVNASLGTKGVSGEYYGAVNRGRTELTTLMFAAIGNNGCKGINNHGSPGNYGCVLGVGAISADDTVADFSDWGAACHPIDRNIPPVSKPDMVAPGVNVFSAIPNKKYATLSGSSMAVGLVSGAAALLIERDPVLRGNPDKLEAQVRTLIRPLSQKISKENRDRGGLGCLDLTSI